MWIFPPRLGKLSNKKALKNGGGAGVIPVILLGDSGDTPRIWMPAADWWC